MRSAQICVFFLTLFLYFSEAVRTWSKVDGKWQAKFQRHLRYRAAGRPTALWASQLPHSLFFCPFLLHPPLPSLFRIFSPILTLFTLFSSSVLLFHFFPQFSSIFPSPPLIVCFFPAFFCDPFVTNVPHEAPPTHRTRHVVKEDFACCSAFSGTFKKKGPNYVKSKKKEGFNFSRNQDPVVFFL